MRRHPFCALGLSGEGQHLPLPDVPEGLRRAVCFLCRYRKKRFRLDPRQPATFRSSSIAERDFCAACGTPLSFRRIDGPRIEIMTGTFDRPDRVVPTTQYGSESRLGWVVGIANLPSQSTQENYGPEKMATIVSHQHPDHD
jgi:hypothetical protein